MQSEKIIAEILKNAMPHLDLKNNKSVDLYFEFLDSQEKGEVFEDLIDGKNIGLPDFKQLNVFNETRTLNKEDLNNKDREISFVDRFLKQKTTKPILEYDENKHKYKIKN